ncbi:quinone oxidoreductase family protein [Streptomyces sp. MMG1121]|uniref:quinone oxidoreductase family protein n=1 Tax=Streptomyces sp. MMG1121 TaxID=1415544 RepID=UPI0006AE3D98|nr:zinc-binding dehydrogenase [Streptomyces sp. MMG1121]KOV66222.1 oxidoreductase [Streptomyces sp. MMG1121]
MRALVMTAPGGSENSEVREIEEPRPGAGQVSVDVAYAGLNFADVMARRGDVGYVSAWPYLPGKEVAGTVRALGEGVTGLTIGDQVVATPAGGGLAQVVVAEAALTVPVPPGVALRQASAVPLGLATAMLLLSDAGRFTPGDTVLVHSASGGIGSAIAQLVPLLGGGRLIGTVGRPEKAKGAVKTGYDAAFHRDVGLREAVMGATDGQGVDLILDPLGTAALELDLDLAAPGGRIVLFGNAGGGAINVLPPAGRLLAGNLTITGFSHRGLAAGAPAKVARAISQVLELLADGRLELPVTELGSLADVPAAHDLMATGAGIGKYVAQVA